MSAEPAIILEEVTRLFGDSAALVRARLVVDRGETVLVEGPNGSGKSTLLRVIATSLSPTYGRGRVLGFDLVEERSEIRRRVELLGHRARLYQDLTGLENLRFCCALYGVAADGVGNALARAGLADVADHRVRGFSAGMRQRLALARAILRAPEVLLLDEPYAGLDRAARGIVRELVHDARRRGATVVIASHERPDVELLDRVVALREGRVVERVAAAAVAR